MLRRIVAAVVLLAVAAVLLVLVWPQLFGLQKAPIIAQVVSFRGSALIAAAGLLIVLALPLVLSRRARRFGGSLAVLLLAFIVVSGVVLGSRGFGSSSLAADDDSEVTVMSWNTLGDAPGAQSIADLALQSDAEIVTLPETSKATADAVAAIMNQAGHPMVVHNISLSTVLKARSTSLLISTKLGGYHLDTTVGSTSTLPSLVARPDSGTGPTIAAVHAVAPQPVELHNWRSDLNWLSTICGTTSTIIAGDFNATIDHMAGLGQGRSTLGTCSDAALQTKNGAVGTWPTSVPAFLGAPIDHVMSTSDWTATSMHVVQDHDKAGSDHRPIVVRLSHHTG